MNLFTVDDLKLLISKPATDVCNFVSIYMPTFRTGPDGQQGPSRLKNLVHQAENKLIANGLRSTEAATLLSPARDLLDNPFFWQYQADGLALFLCDTFFKYYRVPLTFKETVVSAQHFYLKQMFPLLTEDGKYYVLAISQKQVKLLQCTRYSCRELTLPMAVPSSLAEAMTYEDLDRENHFEGHFSAAGYRSHRGEGLAGVSLESHNRTITQENKDRLKRYFRIIDRGLQNILRDERAPMVFASVDYLFPIYKSINRYPVLVDEPITGSPERMSAADMHIRGWNLVKPVFEKTKGISFARYHENQAFQRVSTSIEEIVKNAFYGNIDTLFVDENKEMYGSFNKEDGSVQFHSKNEPCDKDLFDFAVTNTVLHKGTVYVLKKEEVPDGGEMAALLRRPANFVL